MTTRELFIARGASEIDDVQAHIADPSLPNGIGDDPVMDIPKMVVRADQVLCENGDYFAQTDADDLTLAEAADVYDFSASSFEDEPPEEVCSACWKLAREHHSKSEQMEKAFDKENEGFGFRLRWERDGDDFSQWCDMIVHSHATVEEMDQVLLETFPDLDSFHVRMYGIGEEYENSTPAILPRAQYVTADRSHYQNAASVLISDLSKQYMLYEGDGLSLVYDLAAPSRFWSCTITEQISQEEFIESHDENDIEDHGFVFVTETNVDY